MKGSIKFKSEGGATLTKPIGDNTAGEFNVLIDNIAISDPKFAYNAVGGKFILGLIGPSKNTATGGFQCIELFIDSPSAYNVAGVSEAIYKAIQDNNGQGESVVQLPAGATLKGYQYNQWEW